MTTRFKNKQNYKLGKGLVIVSGKMGFRTTKPTRNFSQELKLD
jgi:hypothetical protein